MLQKERAGIRLLIHALLLCMTIFDLSCRAKSTVKNQEVIVRNGFCLKIRNPAALDAILLNRLAAVFFDRYPEFYERFNPNAPKTINVIFINGAEKTNPGSSIQGKIYLYANHLPGGPDGLSETFCHELMHQVLLYNNTVEKWLGEGMADYENFYYGATTLAWRKDSFNNTPRADVSWYSGYHHTAKFLMWLDTKFPGFTGMLHEACLQGTYRRQTYFTEKTNRTIDQLWAMYCKSNFNVAVSD